MTSNNDEKIRRTVESERKVSSDSRGSRFSPHERSYSRQERDTLTFRYERSATENNSAPDSSRHREKQTCNGEWSLPWQVGSIRTVATKGDTIDSNAAKIGSVGMKLAPEDPGQFGFCHVEKIHEGGAVAEDGRVQVGDRLRYVDDFFCEGAKLFEIKRRVQGIAGSLVSLVFDRTGHNKHIRISVRRKVAVQASQSLRDEGNLPSHSRSVPSSSSDIADAGPAAAPLHRATAQHG
jgi:C-terminal processing protease CtpA/Prc